MIQLSMNEIVPLLCEVIENGADFRLYPHGQSMLPTLKEGEDSVLLTKPSNLKKNDIVLYRRGDGQYVLHRIAARHGNSFNMCGDNQYILEKNVPESSVIAKVILIYKKDTPINVSDRKYIASVRRLYLKKPFMRLGHKAKSFLRKIISFF